MVEIDPVSILAVSVTSPAESAESASPAETKMPRLHSIPEVGSSVAFSISSCNLIYNFADLDLMVY